MNTSLAAVQRLSPALADTPACAWSPSLLRAERNLAGSPGAAVFPDKTWNEVVGRLRLSHREGEIVRGVFDDQTEFAIAANLGISPHTVHTHFERLRCKLGVADRVQLILCITREFLRLGAAADRSQPALRAQRPAQRI